MLNFLQFNAGRGREASDLCCRFAAEQGAEVVIITEPYPWMGFSMHGNGKAHILVRKNVVVRQIPSHANDNTVGVTLKAQGSGSNISIVAVYDELSGNSNTRLDAVKGKLKALGRFVLAGDFNAKHEAWGAQEADGRGSSLLEWVVGEGYKVENVGGTPAFQSSRGVSWVVLTITFGAEVHEWCVKEEETLSDHRYIRFGVARERVSDRAPPVCEDFDKITRGGTEGYFTLHDGNPLP